MLAPIINAPALVVGSLVHSALAWWRESPTGDPIKFYESIASMELVDIIDTYTERIGVRPTRDELESVDIAITMGKVMIENYVKVWKQPLPDGYILVNNEQTLLVPIPGTEHCSFLDERGKSCVCAACSSIFCACGCRQVSHMLEATLDGLLADAKNRYFILECKTYSRTPSDAELNDKFQFVAYMWALKQTGIECRAMLYDGLFKSDHQRRGHTLQDNFLRKLLVRNQHEIQEFEQHLAQIAHEMANPNLQIYKTVPWQGCMDCAGYIKLCRAESKGEDTAYILQNYTKRDYKAEGDGWHRSEIWAAQGVNE